MSLVLGTRLTRQSPHLFAIPRKEREREREREMYLSENVKNTIE